MGAAAKSRRLQLIWTDGGYTDPLVEWSKEEDRIELDWIKPPEKGRSFQLVPNTGLLNGISPGLDVIDG